MRLFKNWAKTFAKQEKYNPDPDQLVGHFKKYLVEQLKV